MDKEIVAIAVGCICLTICFVAALQIVPENTVLLGSIIVGILGVLGVPQAVKGVRNRQNRRKGS